MIALLTAVRARFDSYDRPLLFALAGLFVAGFVLSLAASPAATARLDYDQTFRFAWRHTAFIGVGLVGFAACASLSPKGVRRLCVLMFAGCVLLMGLVLIIGPETKGAQRWLHVGPLSLQPSEFLKPALVVLGAWMLSERMKQPRFPGVTAAAALYGIAWILLLLQPDVGQSVLLAMTFAALIYFSGASLWWLVGIAVGSSFVGLGLYALLPHVRYRVDGFLHDHAGYQMGRAIAAFRSGGLTGRGPGEGVVKQTLPDAHSDFIYAVAAEEFGLIASLGLLAIFAFLVWRGMQRAGRLLDPFAQLAAAGLMILIAGQAAIHAAVNLSLIPAKGMTLPLVSYGGSSMLASAMAMGFAAALLRRRRGVFLYGEE